MSLGDTSAWPIVGILRFEQSASDLGFDLRKLANKKIKIKNKIKVSSNNG